MTTAPPGQGPLSGAALFALLFPDEAAYRPVLRALFGLKDETQAVPSRYPVRVRVWTDDPRILAMPWHTLGHSWRDIADGPYFAAAPAPMQARPRANGFTSGLGRNGLRTGPCPHHPLQSPRR